VRGPNKQEEKPQKLVTNESDSIEWGERRHCECCGSRFKMIAPPSTSGLKLPIKSLRHSFALSGKDFNFKLWVMKWH